MANNENISNEDGQKFESGFDLTGLLLDYASHWKWFLLSVILLLAGAYYYIATIIPTYQVSASIYLNDESAQANNNALTFANSNPMLEAKSFIDETEIEILKSRNNLIKIVDSLGLAYSYYTVGQMRDVPVYRTAPVLMNMDSVALHSLGAPVEAVIEPAGDNKYDVKLSTSYKGQTEEKELKATALPVQISLSQGTVTLSPSATASKMTAPEKIVVNNPMRVAGMLSAALNIAYAQNSTTILRVTVDTDIIAEGEDVINALLDFYNQQILEDKNRSAMQTEAFILDRLKMIAGELRDVEDRLKNYRQEHNITNLEAQATMNLSQKSSNEVEIAQVSAQIEMLSTMAAMVSQNGDYSELPLLADNAALQRLVENYNANVAKYSRLTQGKNIDNPDVSILSAREELNTQKSRILSTIGTARRNLEAQRSTLLSLSNRSAGQLAAVPTVDKGLNEIFREQQVKVNIYTFLLQRREEIALQKTLATPTARLIDDPMGYGPVAPKSLTIYAMALLIGLLIPGLIIFIRRALFPIFKDQDELKRMTSLPIISEICQDNTKGDDPIVIGENVSTPIAELFRLLRNNISFTRNGGQKKVILVTSAIAGEGKTFVATNLAMTYALSGRKVIVIGMDIRRPALAHRFHLTNEKGVTTFLSGQDSNVSNLIYQSKENSNLYIMPAGPVPPNPNELLLSDNMKNLMEQLRNDFDYVIIDSAPIGMISDAFLIIPYSDIQLFVTRASYSTKRGLNVLHSAVSTHNLKEVYLVINGVNMRSGSYLYRRYGTYGHYGKTKHAYGYGYVGKGKDKDQ